MEQTQTGQLTVVVHKNQAKTATIRVPVHVLAERHLFGRHELEVSPVGGSGRVWIRRDRVRIDRKESGS